jgi:hypothetical protein
MIARQHAPLRSPALDRISERARGPLDRRRPIASRSCRGARARQGYPRFARRLRRALPGPATPRHALRVGDGRTAPPAGAPGSGGGLTDLIGGTTRFRPLRADLSRRETPEYVAAPPCAPLVVPGATALERLTSTPQQPPELGPAWPAATRSGPRAPALSIELQLRGVSRRRSLRRRRGAHATSPNGLHPRARVVELRSTPPTCVTAVPPRRPGAETR